MAGERSFVVKFIGDHANASKSIKKVGSDLGGLGKNLTSILPSFRTIGIAGAAAFAGVAAASFKLVKMASNLEESQSKANVVFGSSVSIINKFARTASTAFGVTKQAALEAAGTYGNLIQAFGIGQNKAAEMSKTLVALASDLASFNNTSVDEAIQALRSGLSGETEPLKRYGVALNDVRLKQIALTMGIYSGSGALSVSAKTQAAYALILKDTSLAQGDFSRTSGGFANQMKILGASLQDIGTEIGMMLLPYFKRFVSFINDNIVPALKMFVENIKEKGVAGAFVYMVAVMGESGMKMINIMETIVLTMIGVQNKVASFSNKVNFWSGMEGVAYLFGRDLTTASLSADAFSLHMDSLRASIRAASSELANFGKPGKDTSDSLERMGFRAIGAAVGQKKLATSLVDLTDKTGGASKKIKEFKDKLAELTAGWKGAASASKGYLSAQKDSLKAGVSKVSADKNLLKAQEALNRAVAGYGANSPEALAAQKVFEQAQRGVERAGYNVEQSVFAIADAEKALQEVRADPLSTPQSIREAEIRLAEAKLSSADATDAQTEATNGLVEANWRLDEVIYGVSQSSDMYKSLSDAVTQAKLAQADAIDAVAEALDREAEALDKLNEATKAFGALKVLYPKIAANNPMGSVATSIPLTVAGGSMGMMGAGDSYVVNINATVADDKLPGIVVDALRSYNRTRGRLNVAV